MLQIINGYLQPKSLYTSQPLRTSISVHMHNKDTYLFIHLSFNITLIITFYLLTTHTQKWYVYWEPLPIMCIKCTHQKTIFKLLAITDIYQLIKFYFVTTSKRTLGTTVSTPTGLVRMNCFKYLFRLRVSCNWIR